jgi:hypothetical protein
VFSGDICDSKQSVFVATGKDGSDFLANVDGAIVETVQLIIMLSLTNFEVDNFMLNDEFYTFR